MKNAQARRSLLAPSEKDSQKLLMEKMGLSKKEMRQINQMYGVSAVQLLELMRLSKYQFIFTGKVPGQCEPCAPVVKMRLANF